MSQWMGDLAHDYLSGIYRAMHDEMLQSDYLQADETPIDYQSPGHGSVKKGYLWTLSHPDLNATRADSDPATTVRGDIFYQWHEGRSADCLQASCALTSTASSARSKPTPTAPMRATKTPSMDCSPSSLASHTSGENFTKREDRDPSSVDGSYAKSSIFTPSKQIYENEGQAPQRGNESASSNRFPFIIE